jgi:hypothetical protein
VSAPYGVTFLILAFATAFGTIVADPWPVRVLAGSAALALALLAAAYLGAGPRLLLKRPDGTRPWWSWLLLWPYLLLNVVSFSLFRLVSREAAYTPVAPNLYLGRRLTAREVRAAAGVGWTSVLDLAAEFAEVGPLRGLPHYRSLPVLDATAPSWEQLHVAVDWLKERVAQGPVLVHCALGHGRSATVVLAYLLARGQVADPKEGLGFLRSRRGSVGLHPGQAALLRRFAGSLSAHAE